MAITEAGCSIVKPGIDVMDESTPEGQILLKIWKGVTSQPTGPFRVFWGTEVENPANLWGFFDFASVEEHEKFAEEFGKDIVTDFPKILGGHHFTKHVTLTPYPHTALRAPVTEVLLIWFPSDLAPEVKDAATKRLQQFADACLGSNGGIHAINIGWGVENDFPVRDGEEGQKGSLLTAMIGWLSIATHIQFRETDTFKDNIHLLRGIEGFVKMTMFHIKSRVMENETRRE
ncbi:hypothetical protein KVR01_000970 [Diaporthe batatas]|uniref:uncharacterized protein n=1 Tax=Diaporthe batatas TaxID=748121 RepID=UPI001D0380A1|nr:uncharacterized protein KVR01_000970 [Diaporthe batatas]KAG8170225.1 hypothetical protein KVR01_000970 [Diaporthe batatas]